jgi:predicted nuclease of predicted toxin-antitoxin system
MTLRFFVDAQLPLSLARFLISKGYEAEHVGDISAKPASDLEI